MGHSKAEKAKNRERILDEAAAQIRKSGLESVSVGKLMAKVNLTHGGFYGHFASRSDLIAQALERALGSSQAAAKASHDPEQPKNFRMWVKSYLSRAHRDSPNTGCAIAALISDVGRADQQVRSVIRPHIENYLASLAQSLGDDDRAMVAVSAMIGALALSRAVADPKRSDAILRAVRDGVIAMREEE
jgi:TetR/AcrR family transcriptional repressor of nem operon